MSFEFRPRPASVLIGLLAAGLVLTVAGCGHLTPLRRYPGNHHLRSGLRGLLIPAEELLGPGDARAAHLPDHDHPARCRCSRGDSGRHDGL